MIDEKPIRTRFQAVRSSLNERDRRLHVAAEAASAGHGGVAAASRATNLARSTIGRGLKDLQEPSSLTGKVRRKGAGRPTATPGFAVTGHTRRGAAPGNPRISSVFGLGRRPKRSKT
jgi:hypothetical protein